MRFRGAFRCLLSSIAALALIACGGGGSGASSSSELSITKTHAQATVAVSPTNAQHLLAHSFFVVKALHNYLRNFAGFVQLSGISPASPSVRFLCNGGAINMTYTDVDKDSRWSPGDTIRFDSDGCGMMSAHGGGSELLTVLTADGGTLTSARIQFLDSKYDWLTPSSSVGIVSGTATLRRAGDNELLESVGDMTVVVSSAGNAGPVISTLTISNLSMAKLSAQAYAANAEASMDVSFSTPLVSSGRAQVETEGAIGLVEATNEAPSPGKLQVRGSGSTNASLAGDPNITSFKVEADTTGSGSSNLIRVFDVDSFFSALYTF